MMVRLYSNMNKIEVYKKQFNYYKELADSAVDQLDDKDLFFQIGEEVNSIAVIMKHLSGNMHSRWTNLFQEDGEKDWRNRDEEFIDRFEDINQLKAYWEAGWDVLFSTLDSLSEKDLDRTIYIRNMGCSVHDAIIRQLCHYPYHVGQIVHIAKELKGKSFKSLSIPKGESKTYNTQRFSKEKSMKHFTDDKDTQS